jgi:hypothetical protein
MYFIKVICSLIIISGMIDMLAIQSNVPKSLLLESPEINESYSSQINVMEYWVKLEVNRQLKKFQRLHFYINPSEVVAYALNRLPPLYASSQEGILHQIEKEKLYEQKVRSIVLQALKVILSTPIGSMNNYQPKTNN